MIKVEEEGDEQAGEDYEEDGLSPFHESNKKLTFFVIDGSSEMVGDGGEESSFRAALKIAYSHYLRIGCSSSLTHLFAVIIANTKKSSPAHSLVDKFFVLTELDFVCQEGAVTIKNLIDQPNLKKAFKERFDGNASADLGSLLFYIRTSARNKSLSNRQLVVNVLTNGPKPFGCDSATDKSLIAAKRQVEDLRRTGGVFSVHAVGKKDVDLTLWKIVDDEASYQEVDELERIVYQKAFAPRAHAILPFRIGSSLTAHVSIFTLAAETKKPTGMHFDAESEERVFSRTVYRPKEENGVGESDSCIPPPLTLKKNEDSEDSSGLSLNAEHRERSHLNQALSIGGKNVLFDQKEISLLKSFEKGINVLGFKPISKLAVDRHSEPCHFLYPSETKMRGSRCLLRSLLDRCRARQQMVISSMTYSRVTRPRLVSLVPHLDKNARMEGFLVVPLPLADDCIDGRLIEQNCQKPAKEENEEERKAASALVDRLSTSYSPFENPQLQSFYTMLVEYAVGEKPKEPEDNIVAYFKADGGGRVGKELASFSNAFDITEEMKMKATKRAAASSSGAREKRVKKTGEDDLEQAARSGKLNSMTVAELRAAASSHGISIPPSQKKKQDIIDCISEHFI